MRLIFNIKESPHERTHFRRCISLGLGSDIHAGKRPVNGVPIHVYTDVNCYRQTLKDIRSVTG